MIHTECKDGSFAHDGQRLQRLRRNDFTSPDLNLTLTLILTLITNLGPVAGTLVHRTTMSGKRAKGQKITKDRNSSPPVHSPPLLP